MIFSRVIEHVFDKEFNLKQRVFTDYLGFTKKTTRKYFNGGLKEGRGLNQFVMRLNSIKRSSKSNLVKYISSEFLRVFESLSGKVNYTDQPVMHSFVDGYRFGITETCKELNVNPDMYLSSLPSVFYSMNFIDAVHHPFRSGPFDITPENFESLVFPYNKLSKHDVDRYFNVVSLKDRPHVSNAGPEVHRLLKETFAGILASISLDLERLGTSGIDIESHFLESNWGESNIVAKYFCWFRDSSGCNTHDQFYGILAENFHNIDFESVKTNYKRWCKTGRLKKEQLFKLSESISNIDNGEVQFFMQYIMTVFLQFLKEVLEECSIEYTYESFKLDVNKWKGWIKAEYPLESWQPSKAANGVATL
jgi:hypothetical protein